MGCALNLYDHHLNDEKTINTSSRKKSRLEGKVCPSATDVKDSTLHYKNNAVHNAMKSFSYPVARNERQLDDEFTLEMPCFDFFPVLKDIESPRENLDIRWRSIWNRLFFNVQRAIQTSNTNEQYKNLTNHN